MACVCVTPKNTSLIHFNKTIFYSVGFFSFIENELDLNETGFKNIETINRDLKRLLSHCLLSIKRNLNAAMTNRSTHSMFSYFSCR